MDFFPSRTRVAGYCLLMAVLGLVFLGIAHAEPATGSPVYCFSAGAANNWNCEKSEQSDTLAAGEYHTLRVVIETPQEAALLEEILPIERLGQLQLPSGGHIVFLGKFRDSMKAHRVADECQLEYPQKCAQFAIQVTRIEGGLDEVQPDLQYKASGDLVSTVGSLLEPARETQVAAIDVKPGTVVPRGLLKLKDGLEHILWVDLRAGNLHVLQRDAERFRLARTMSVSMGKAGYGKLKQGDKKTPVGVYRLMGHLTDQQLDDFYGSGAYTLNYPNALDKIKQRDGSGIWLHGLPKGKDYRPLKDSDGCVILSNTMIEDLGRYVDLQSTPIVLDDQFEWVSGESQQPRRAELEQAIASWRSAWILMENDKYLAYYADDFTNLEKNLAEWKRYKRRIHASKKFINVTVSQLNLLDYPSEPNMVLARFYQRYESSNFRSKGWKEQLWRKEESGQWRIVYERG